MKKNLVYLVFSVALLTSCSSAYRSSQTPDDVYYSPGQKEYAQNQDRYETYSNSSDDNYLRMKVQDNNRWSSIDDYDYWYDSRYYANNNFSPYTSAYGLSLGLGYGYGGYGYNPYNTFGYSPWQSWYNPYYTVVYYKNPTVYYKPVNRTNLSTYNNKSYNNTNMPLQNGNRSNAYNNSNSNVNRNNRNNNYVQPNRTTTDTRPVRTFNNSSSNTSSGGGTRVGGSSGGGSRTRP